MKLGTNLRGLKLLTRKKPLLKKKEGVQTPHINRGGLSSTLKSAQIDVKKVILLLINLRSRIVQFDFFSKKLKVPINIFTSC